jgi:predicted deacylase
LDGKLGRDAARNVKLIRAAATATLDALQPANELDTMRRALMRLSHDADIVLDLHCDMVAALHLFTNARDRESVRDLAGYLGAEATMFNEAPPAVMTFSGANGAYWWKLAERFGDAAPVPQACFSITVEFRGQGDVNHKLGDQDASALLKFLIRRGVVGGTAAPVPRLKGAITPMSGMDVGYCPGAGVVTYFKPAGAKVRAGEVICEVFDPIAADPTNARTPVETRASGVLFSRRSDDQLVWPGRVLFRVAGATPLPHRAGRSGLDD